jgi:hypothetical protein
MKLAAILLLCGWLLPAVPAYAQQTPPSLGEIARQEAERRKALKAAGKVYTKDDLPKAALLPPMPAPPAGAPAAEAQQEPALPAGEEKDEAWWRARITAVREAERRNEMFAAALQSRINSLAADFSSRDDPAQRALIGEERNKALAELERVTAEIEAAKKQIAEIEDEARREGVPPGWLR